MSADLAPHTQKHRVRSLTSNTHRSRVTRSALPSSPLTQAEARKQTPVIHAG